jgi:hypothetical protein
MYAADAMRGEKVLAPLRGLGDPLVDLSGLMPYTVAQQLLDEDYPDGWRYCWKSVDLDELGATCSSASPSMPRPLRLSTRRWTSGTTAASSAESIPARAHSGPGPRT